MSDKKPWQIEHIQEPMITVFDGKLCESKDYYKVSFKGLMYGAFGGEALACKTPNELMQLFFQILNDAHHLALTKKDEANHE